MATSYNDKLTGNAYDNYLNGKDGDDILIGGKGSDILVGSNGNDNLFGYGGNTYEFDDLYGGSGADNFWLGNSKYGDYYKGRGYAVIHDFNWKAGDKFVLSGDINQYLLVKDKNFLGGAARDTAIYKGNDLLAIVKDTINVVASQDFIVG
jgi:RTX calcium-binding nonapeptide repeat (4 copies)